jgi:histone H3/H4
VAIADVIVKSDVKDAMREKNVAADFYDALDERVMEVLEAAEVRADSNGRKTVQPRDL